MLRLVAHAQKVHINFMKLMLDLKDAFIAAAWQVLAAPVAKALAEAMLWAGSFAN